MLRPILFVTALVLAGLSAQPASAGLFSLLFGEPPKPTIRYTAPEPLLQTPQWSAPASRVRRDARPMTQVTPTRREGAARIIAAPQRGAAYCVRTCDGYYFPLDAKAQNGIGDAEMCSLACPGPAMEVFRKTGDDMRDAVGPSGARYRSLPQAFTYRKATVAASACRKPASYAEWAARMVADPTLRRGDIVVNLDSAAVFNGSLQRGQPVRQADLRDIREPGAVSATGWRRADRSLGFTFRQELVKSGGFTVASASTSEPIAIVVTPARPSFTTVSASAPAAVAVKAVLASPFAPAGDR